MSEPSKKQVPKFRTEGISSRKLISVKRQRTVISDKRMECLFVPVTSVSDKLEPSKFVTPQTLVQIPLNMKSSFPSLIFGKEES